MQTDQVAANERLGALEIALEDIDAQASRFESEIDAVRQREDRDRSLLHSVADAKQLSELQHELDTLRRRQSSLEDSLLEVMELFIKARLMEKCLQLAQVDKYSGT